MFKVIYGDDRLASEKAVRRLLGENYEVFEGENVAKADLPSIFQGLSLFGGEKRRILLKDWSENAEIWEKLPEYLATKHDVVLWEAKIDKRSVIYKQMQQAGVEFAEFTEVAKPDIKLVFGIFETALRDSPRAVKMVEQIEATQDAYMFFGLMVTQALKRFDNSAQGKRVLKALAELDLQMKTTALEPWLLIKSFLLQASNL